jgi:hypothetical protein
VAVFHQAAHHVAAHSSEPDHAKLHLLDLRNIYLKFCKIINLGDGLLHRFR